MNHIFNHEIDNLFEFEHVKIEFSEALLKHNIKLSDFIILLKKLYKLGYDNINLYRIYKMYIQDIYYYENSKVICILQLILSKEILFAHIHIQIKFPNFEKDIVLEKLIDKYIYPILYNYFSNIN